MAGSSLWTGKPMCQGFPIMRFYTQETRPTAMPPWINWEQDGRFTPQFLAPVSKDTSLFLSARSLVEERQPQDRNSKHLKYRHSSIN